MILFKKASDLTGYLQMAKLNSTTSGFVPTMGALHSGHISLINRSRAANQLTIVSIFVNPTQFNDPKDFQKYPVTLEKDIAELEKAGTDILFLPSVEEIYPTGLQAEEKYELGYLETILEGKYRPGHFQGVCQVMHRLIDITRADNLYMGQKDYQQCLVIKKLLKLKNLPGTLHICPTLREADGLAMSSRNLRLNEEERSKATCIYKALDYLKQHLQPGPVDELESIANRFLTEQGFKTDYVEIADAETLELVSSWNGKARLTGLIAAFNNEVRLIDNMIITAN
jgi:pantoate--beta-alanine ligase